LKQPTNQVGRHQVLPSCNDQQMTIVNIVSSMKLLPVATLVQTVRQVLKTPPNLAGGVSSNVEISILQFFYFYLEKCAAQQVFQSWSTLASLLKDCLVLAPPAIFLALAILNRFVQRTQQIADENAKKNKVTHFLLLFRQITYFGFKL
jgi:hypothetical protein